MRILAFLFLCLPAFGQDFGFFTPEFDPRENSQLLHWWDGSFGVSGNITVKDLVGSKDMAAASHQPTQVALALKGWSVLNLTNSQYVTCSGWINVGANWHGLWVGRVSNLPCPVADTATNHQIIAVTTGPIMDCNDVLQLRTSSSAPASLNSFSVWDVSCSSGVPTFKQNGTDLGRSGSGVMSAGLSYNSLGNVLNVAFMNGQMALFLQYSAPQTGMPYAKATNWTTGRFGL